MTAALIELAQRPANRPPYAALWRSLAEVVQKRAQLHPERPYLIAYDGDGSRHAYINAEFARRVSQFAAYLQRLGVSRGHRVGTILHNHPEHVFLMYAAWWLGAALVPINVEEPPERKRFILLNADVRVLFTLPEFEKDVAPFPVVTVGDRLDPGAEEADPTADQTDEALIVYTSGTTGNPKGVVLTQYNLLADADAIARWFRMAPEDRWMCVLPIHHVNGIIVTLLSPLYAGASVVLNRRFSTQTFWQRAAAESISVCSMVPTLLEFLLEAGGEGPPPSMRGVICGAGPLAVETVLRFEERFGIAVWHGYGLSETTAYACMTPVDLTPDVRRHWYSAHGFPTMGAAMDHQEVSVRDADGNAVEAGVRGEICIRGSTIMQGYYQRPDANAEAFRFPGWFRSGDEGFWLEGPAGRPLHFITGRIKELIIRGGVNLSPLEIDAVLTSHPAVRFGMSVPFENRIYGEEVAGYVVLRDGYTPSDALAEEIRAFTAETLPFHMQPKVILFGLDVPYTSTGKPKRLALKALLAERLLLYRDIQFREGRRHEHR